MINTKFGKIKQYLENKNLSDDEIFNIIAKTLEPDFEINESNRELYIQLKLYFKNDKNFNGSLNKGLLLIGGYGSGKTLALKIFYVFTIIKGHFKNFAFFDNDAIIDSFTKSGRPSIDQYNGWYNIAIDDLGEDSGKHYFYGSEDDPVDVLLSRRYLRFKDDGKLTHATSNLDTLMLKDRFSGKVYDRMYEMFNIIPVNGESWRKKK